MWGSGRERIAKWQWWLCFVRVKDENEREKGGGGEDDRGGQDFLLRLVLLYSVHARFHHQLGEGGKNRGIDLEWVFGEGGIEQGHLIGTQPCRLGNRPILIIISILQRLLHQLELPFAMTVMFFPCIHFQVCMVGLWIWKPSRSGYGSFLYKGSDRRHSSSFQGTTYLRLPKSNSFCVEEESANANSQFCSVNLDRPYTKSRVNSFVKFLLWFAAAIGVFEIVCFFLVWYFLIRTRQKSDADQQGYNLAASGFRKFSYSELKEATKGFSQEIGRGAGGVVYKGLLSDKRIAAIKRLSEAKQGEGEFLAEVSIIGRLNHMNLIEMWGYYAEGKHRLLVYEYMENGSLAENLMSNTLDWSKRYNVALGTARVLAYLHEECLEWILHCDIKPQNILLDSTYQPKVADFGLSKLLNRNDLNTPSFSMIRGTRGYMAPEWVFNLPITSKVDVYSYGIVVLEMLTGRRLTTGIQTVDGVETNNGRLVTWVREKRSKAATEMSYWVEQIIDPAIEPQSEFEVRKMETLARVALDCVEEDKDARPTMSRVAEILQSHGNYFS